MPLPPFSDWLSADARRLGATWLVLGKGPSFARLDALTAGGATAGCLRLGLNHVVRETQVEVFHCIDLEVLDQCGDAVLANAGIAVLPWAPHVRRRLVPFSAYQEFLPSGRSLAEHAAGHPVLARLAAAGRLYWYNLHTAPRRLRRPEAPVTPARGFSASAVVALLAAAGVRRIRTLGIDGGQTYAAQFTDLTRTTLLAAGQGSFDRQFGAFAALIGQYRLDLAPLDQPPARVRILCRADERLPAQVLASALRRHASLTLAIEHQPVAPGRAGSGLVGPGLDGPWSSGSGGGGPAVVLRAASLVEADPRALFVGANPAPLPAPADQRRAGDTAPPPAWSVTPADQPGAASRPLIGWFAGRPCPWRHAAAPAAARWCRALLAAVAAGDIDRDLVAAEVRRGHARASLLWQLDHQRADPLLLPRRERAAEPAGGPRLVVGPARALDARVATALACLYAARWRRYAGLTFDKAGKVLRGLGR